MDLELRAETVVKPAVTYDSSYYLFAFLLLIAILIKYSPLIYVPSR